MSSKPLLVYWDFRALGEPIRLLLHYLQVNFEDRRIPLGEIGPNIMEPWLRQKYTLGLDFPNLPYYVDEDVKITQSMAILQHIGRKYKLCGETIQEQAILDMVTQTANDLRWSCWTVYKSSDFHEIKDDWKKTIPERLSEMNRFLEGKDFILGSKISYGDFFLYECMEWFRQFDVDLFENSPELKNITAFQKRIEALPQIKKYMESEAFKAWPIFGPIVNFGWSKDSEFRAMPFSVRNFVSKFTLDLQEPKF